MSIWEIISVIGLVIIFGLVIVYRDEPDNRR